MLYVLFTLAKKHHVWKAFTGLKKMTLILLEKSQTTNFNYGIFKRYLVKNILILKC